MPWTTILLWYLLAVNILEFLLMGSDKRRAKKGAWRIPERTLLLTALFGGSVGGVLGMAVFRHKTRHWYFALGLPLMLLAHCGLAFLLLRG
jgi:uncharacterized membrane protein YsdA (DUF1294 family)